MDEKITLIVTSTDNLQIKATLNDRRPKVPQSIPPPKWLLDICGVYGFSWIINLNEVGIYDFLVTKFCGAMFNVSVRPKISCICIKTEPMIHKKLGNTCFVY